MKATIITGSARKCGNTDTLCSIASDTFKEKGYDVLVFRAYDMNVNHCTNCGGCIDSGDCVINDDMDKIYNAIESSDIILFCTPVHFSGMSSIMKQVVDRLQCMWYRPPSERERKIGVIINGGNTKPCFRNIVSVAKAVTNTLGAEWAGEYCVKDTDNGLSKETFLEVRDYVLEMIQQEDPEI